LIVEGLFFENPNTVSQNKQPMVLIVVIAAAADFFRVSRRRRKKIDSAELAG